MSRPLDTVVIGGGVSGLATAALLAADGHQVTLLEAQPQLGGRAGSWESGGFRFDTGPSWYLMPEVFDHFYRLMGTSADEQLTLRRLDPGYRAYFEGDREPYDLPAGGPAARAALKALDPESADRLDAYFDSAAETYHLALEKFLYSSFDSVAPFLDPALLSRLPRLARLLTRSLDAEIRTRTGDSRLRRLLGYPAVFLGGSPMRVPSMYHLMSHLDVNDDVRYPDGGFA
ncbi:MAG: phytoene desaturase, partial [Cellulomonas sp.]|nr:phytoene desaturase [Cellulomonas sp.]